MNASDPLNLGYTPGQDLTLDRLQEQIGWYDRKSIYNQKAYLRLKICTMTAAALIPFLPNISRVPKEAVAGLGVLIVILEGLQQIYQFHANWIAYRATCEALKHEKFLYLATAGPYAKSENPRTLLAEQIESLVSQEHAKWTANQAQGQQPPPTSTATPAPEPNSTSVAGSTPAPEGSSTAVPTSTPTPESSSTSAPGSTLALEPSSTAIPTSTPAPAPTSTAAPIHALDTIDHE